MNHEDNYPSDDGRNDRAEIVGRKISEMKLEKKIETPEKIFGLGKKTAELYSQTRGSLSKKLGSDFAKTMAAALHEYWFACWDGAIFYQIEIAENKISDNPQNRELSTPDGYAAVHGWVDTLTESLQDDPPVPARKRWIKDLTGIDIPRASIVYQCMAVLWIYKASVEMESGHIEAAFDLIYEANDALTEDYAYSMWNDGWEAAVKDAEEMSTLEDLKAKSRNIDREVELRLSEKARKAALAGHKEHRQFKDDVFSWCEDNRTKYDSRSKAAEAVSNNIVPIKYRTAYSYITEWDKTNPLAAKLTPYC